MLRGGAGQIPTQIGTSFIGIYPPRAPTPPLHHDNKKYSSSSVAGGCRPPPLRSSPQPRAFGSGCVRFAPAFAGGAPAALPPAPPFLPSRSLVALFVALLVRAVHSSASCNILVTTAVTIIVATITPSGWRVVGGRARSLPFGRRFRASPSCLCAFLRCRVGGGASSGCGRVLCPSGDVSALRPPAFAPFCAVVLRVAHH